LFASTSTCRLEKVAAALFILFKHKHMITDASCWHVQPWQSYHDAACFTS